MAQGSSLCSMKGLSPDPSLMTFGCQDFSTHMGPVPATKVLHHASPGETGEDSPSIPRPSHPIQRPNCPQQPLTLRVLSLVLMNTQDQILWPLVSSLHPLKVAGLIESFSKSKNQQITGNTLWSQTYLVFCITYSPENYQSLVELGVWSIIRNKKAWALRGGFTHTHTHTHIYI